ncbi:YkyA family protein [Falsibacillus pallidus]|uniref:Putative cell-wall binding lipoprotein n=1 Tax=Falsibacillus pallidus TaxID=493781 RepID=A0A370GVR4_9BACI|nr:YkyA family protein [Falsibacillus pallidus]RDI47621.1 putative cell-wall binding lipoprotein [Falsibacillus pallidus]
MLSIRWLILAAAVALVLSGCMSRPTAAEEIYKILENTVKDEKEFQDQQEPMTEMEMKEKKLFDEIMGLGVKQYDRIAELADKALVNLKNRRQRLEREQQSMDESKQNFEEVKEKIELLNDKDAKKKAGQLITLMEKRYEAHESLYKDYSSGLSLDERLYSLLKKKDVSLEELEEQINKINDIYKKIYADNDHFNQKTAEYNTAKLQFYQIAGININE